MSGDAYPVRSSEPESRERTIRLLGVNNADPTKEVGKGVTVTRTAEGVYLITWTRDPGYFMGVKGYMFGGLVAADCKGYTATRGLYSATAYTLSISVWNSTFAAADIIADQYLDITIAFKATSSAV